MVIYIIWITTIILLRINTYKLIFGHIDGDRRVGMLINSGQASNQ